jgi:hypothetical protein
MLVTPTPIGFAIFVSQLGKVPVFAMVLFHPDTISPIFMAIPVVVIVVLFVMITAIIGAQCRWRYRDWDHESGRKQSCI